MTRFLLACTALAFTVPGVLAAPVPADGNKTTTFPYPAKVPVVVCLNGYDKARDRLNKLVTAALPDDAPTINKFFNAQLDKLLEGRKLTGVRKDVRAFLVVNDLGVIMQGSVPVSVLVPVTSYKEFRETFFTTDEQKSYEKGRDGVDSIKTAAAGEASTVHLVDLKEYVAVTPEKGVADAYAGKYTSGSTEPMGAEAADAFLKGDLALYVNMDAINDQFGDQIRQARGFIDLLGQQFMMQGAGLSKKQLEAMKTLFKGMFQGIEDCRAIVVGSEFRPEGLMVRLQMRFAENTPSTRLIQAAAASPLREIGKLPAGLSSYSETHFSEALAGIMRELNQEFIAAEDDDGAAGKLDEAVKARLAAGPSGVWNATKTPGTAIAVSEYKDRAKAAQATVNEYRAITTGGRIGGTVVKSAPKVKEKAEKDREFEFTQIQIQFDFDATVAALPEAAKEAALEMLKKNATEKTITWIGTDGKVVIQLTAKDWAAAKAVLAEYLDGKSVGKDEAFKATRSQLPADAALLVIADTASTISQLLDTARSSLQASPFPIPGLPNIGAVKPYNGPATYMGLAITMKGDSIGLSGYIPTGAMAVTRKLVEGLLKNVE